MSSQISRNTLIGAIVIAVVVTAIAVGGLIFIFFPPQGEADVLEIYHWWTSGGENAAINALVDVFESQHPNTTVIQNTVPGGAGFEFLQVMKTLVLAGQAPDAFQLHAGYEGIPYFNAGALEQIDALWESEGWKNVVPAVVQSMCQFDGHFYMVPVNIHRSNVVWYNLPLLQNSSIDPSTLTTWTAFKNALTTLKNDGVQYPLYMGEAWTEAHLFEQIMASQGIAVYEDWINGKITTATNTNLVAALTTFKELMAFVNPDASDLSWDAATAKVISGDAAFNIMGDWANGEFTVANKVYRTDYGTMAVPGTGDMYGLVIDAFQHPKGVQHPSNSDNWLKVVGSKEGQDAFNPLKGSISARNDTDLAKYGDYQKAAIADFKSVTHMFPSVVHGSGAPEAFKVDLNNIISQFVTDGDIKAAATAIAKLASDNAADYTQTWSLA